MRIVGASLVLFGVMLYLAVRHLFFGHWIAFMLLGKLGWLTAGVYLAIASLIVGVGLVLASFLKRRV